MKASWKRNLTGRRGIATAAMAATAMTGTGVVAKTAFADSHSNTSTAKSTQKSSGVQGTATASSASSRSDLKQASDIAVKTTKGTVTSVDLDTEKGKSEWHVDVVDTRGNKQEVTVSTDTGKGTATKQERNDGVVKVPATDVKKATDAALSSVKGTATSAKLESGKDKASVWKIDVVDSKGAEREVVVNAETGKVATGTTEKGHH